MSTVICGRSEEYYTAHNIINMCRHDGITETHFIPAKISLDPLICKTQKNYKWWTDEDLNSQIKAEFQDYINRTKNKVLIFRGRETGEGYVIPYRTRFDGNYRIRVRKGLRGVHISKGTLLTLTCDPNRFQDIDEATRAVKKGWNRIRTNLSKRFGCLSYLMVLEFGKEHNLPHLHIILKNIEFTETDRSWVKKLWEKHVATIIDTKQIRNVGAASYVLKYLKKTFNETGNLNYDGNAWCYWVTNTKFYSISEDLEPPEVVANKILDEAHLMDYIEHMLYDECYEYIGICSAEHAKDPPKVITDAWLIGNGWHFNQELGYWESPEKEPENVTVTGVYQPWLK